MSKTKISIAPSQISERWNRRMKAAVTDIQAGIEAVTENPADKAIAKQDKMLQNITQAVQDGRWAAGLRQVSLADWKSKAKNKVGSRLATGVDEAMPKRQKFDTWLVQTINAKLPEIANMPDMTISDSINRCAAMIEHMHNNRYKK